MTLESIIHLKMKSMSYQDKKYIAPTGHDFTQYVNTEEDFKIFEKMCEHEEKTRDVPVADCIEDVVAALNLGRDLMGVSARVNVIKPQNVPMN